MKRILFIIALLVVIIGIFIGIYILFANSSGAKLTTTGGNAFGDTAAGTVQSKGQVGAAGSAGTVVAPNLVEITTSPVAAGVSILDTTPSIASTTQVITASSTATSTASSTISTASTATTADVIVHYIDRESGNVYSYGALSRTLTRISNKTLPGIQVASWVPDGSLAFVQFLAQADATQHLDTYALPATGNGGFFLQQDLESVLALGQNTVFTLLTGTDSSIGSTASADGSNEKTLFTSPLTSLTMHPAGSTVIAATKAASELDGYAFSLNASGIFTPVIGPYKGLTILPSPSGNQLLYSYTDGATFHMHVVDLSTGSDTALPIATLAEKCVWTSDESALYCGVPSSLSGNEPDAWYQGTVSFTDRLWRIDLTTRLATLVLDPQQAGKVTIDMTNLAVDANNRVLVFRNKIDGSLWTYSL